VITGGGNLRCHGSSRLIRAGPALLPGVLISRPPAAGVFRRVSCRQCSAHRDLPESPAPPSPGAAAGPSSTSRGGNIDAWILRRKPRTATPSSQIGCVGNRQPNDQQRPCPPVKHIQPARVRVAGRPPRQQPHTQSPAPRPAPAGKPPASGNCTVPPSPTVTLTLTSPCPPCRRSRPQRKPGRPLDNKEDSICIPRCRDRLLPVAAQIGICVARRVKVLEDHAHSAGKRALAIWAIRRISVNALPVTHPCVRQLPDPPSRGLRDSSKSWDMFSLAGGLVAGAGAGGSGRCGVFPP
jgi:hypothetical protein